MNQDSHQELPEIKMNDQQASPGNRPWSMHPSRLALFLVLGSVAVWLMWSRNSAPATPVPRAERVAPANSSFAENLNLSNPADPGKVAPLPADSTSGAMELALPLEPVPPSEVTPEQVRAIVPGFWKSSFYGTRYLHVRDDGTATIFFQANTLARMFVGSKLKIEYNWEYYPEHERVEFKTISGSPQKSLEYVQKTWGTDQAQTVESISKTELNLVDPDGKTKHHWTRLDEIPQSVRDAFAE